MSEFSKWIFYIITEWIKLNSARALSMSVSVFYNFNWFNGQIAAAGTATAINERQ